MEPDRNADEGHSFAQLQHFVAETIATRQGPALRGTALVEGFLAALPACQIVSFDIFDTLLVRRVHQPSDVFLHLERTEPFRRQASWPAPPWQLRVQAENQARRQLHQASGSGEATLSEIYAAFCALTKLPADRAAALVRAEEEVELKLCRACPALAALYEQAVKSGKRVLFVSDTYHHARFLRELLVANGFAADADHLFASSDLRLNKQSGQLFTAFLQRTGTLASSILHVGDHPVSDY